MLPTLMLHMYCSQDSHRPLLFAKGLYYSPLMAKRGMDWRAGGQANDANQTHRAPIAHPLGPIPCGLGVVQVPPVVSPLTLCHRK